MTQEALTKRIEEYLSAGGLFNPELANHVAVRDLLIECREALREHAMREVQRLGQEIEQEPVAWADHGVVNWIADKQFKHAALLYEAPRRTWVGLTDEEIKKIAKKHKWHEGNVEPHLMPVYRSLEAKLKQLNT